MVPRHTPGDKLAETASQYLTKGRQVFVVGELQEPRTFTDRDGNTRVLLEVRALTITVPWPRSWADGSGPVTQTSGERSSPLLAHEIHDEDIPF